MPTYSCQESRLDIICLVMKMIALFLSGVFSIAMSGCESPEGTESAVVDFIIIRMVSPSPTSPILYYRNKEIRSMGEEFAKEELCIDNIQNYQLKAAQLKRLKRIAVDAPDRDRQKPTPYFVIEIGSRQAAVVAYSMNRETLLKMIHILPSEASGYIQIMYDAGSQ